MTASAVPPALLRSIAVAIGGLTGEIRATPLSGGNISAVYRLDAGDHPYFLKVSTAEQWAMFEAEAAALAEIAATGSVRVPEPVVCRAVEDQSFLLLEWLDLYPLNTPAAERLGRQLAALHGHTVHEFGWWRDNTIGATAQHNTPNLDWLAFWKEQRLGFQLELAASNGYGGRLQQLGERLVARCDALFGKHASRPSLLHGDLWGGNAGCLASGEPVLFDPACYYGDREADLAMTALFGGFPASFMQAYEAVWPLPDGYRLRRDFYNLYHLLNHLNLFGAGYLARSEVVMRRLLAELD